MTVTRQVSLLLFLAGAAVAQIPGDAAIRGILSERIDKQRQGVGIVVGIVDPAGRRVISYGKRDSGDTRPLDGDTVFEIGSATKVFTALLLADMVERREVALTDPAAKYLPSGGKMPERGGVPITLLELATHHSALPRLPSNLVPANPANPYADYSVEQLYEFLRTYQLTRDIGAKYEYSNLGAGLLGHLLTRRAGVSYEELVRTRICAPLGMNSTVITLSPEIKPRLAAGHNAQLAPAGNWDLPTLAGAGALRSTANDMLAFLAANLGYTKSPLAPAMAAMLKSRRPTGLPEVEIALGWHVSKEIVWHNGGTGGYRSYVGFDPAKRTGVVVLSNTFTPAGVDDIGRHLLDARLPLLSPPKERKAIPVDPKLFDGYVGLYEFAPGMIMTVTREANSLYLQLSGQGKAEVFPETIRDYFYKVVDAQVTFETDDQGRATALVLHQFGRDQRARRIPGEPPKPVERKQVAVDPKIFDGYVGRYQLAPNFVLAITREGSRLFAQATGQPRFEIFPENEQNYFFKVVDAQITFETDTQGRATQLILHQNGAHMPAKRIE